MKYEILAIDVWGNKTDGFEINESQGTGIFIDIPESATDAQALKIIRRACGHRADARGYHNVSHCDDFFFCRNSDGMPSYLVRSVV